MRLTDPLSLSPSDIPSAVADMAAIAQSSLTMTPLGELRYGTVPAAELTTWLEECYAEELPADLAFPRISGFEDGEAGPDVTCSECLVVRDLDMVSLGEKHGGTGDGDGLDEPAGFGRIVAYAEFKYHPPALQDAQNPDPGPSKEPSESKSHISPIQLPLSIQPLERALHTHWNNTVEVALAAQFSFLRCFEVRGLSTLSPSHLRHGIASKLLRWIFPLADRWKIPVVLAATPPGYPLYLKYGFVPVGPNGGVIECDMKEWGGRGVHRHVLMVRWPSGKDG